MEARHARKDLADALTKGTAVSVAGPRLDAARQDFIAAARDGVALDKWGRRYRRRAWEDLESSLRRLPDSLARRRLGDITRGDVQNVIDDMTRAGASGSRVRSVVNALRSLYRWAQDRDLVGHDPAANVRLPAMEAKPRDRVATPAEFAQLLAALELADALPWALAGYATARKQEIRILDWRHVDLKLGAIELAADEEGRKPGGSWRVVPLVKPLRKMLREAWIAQGRPTAGQGLPAATAERVWDAQLGAIQRRVRGAWRSSGLEPIGLHESRHTAATWLDHAGVSPKVASTLMGHKTPEYQPGAASITLRRYTHTLPGELERARDLLDRFLVARTRGQAGEGMTRAAFVPPGVPPAVRRARIDTVARSGGFLKTGDRSRGPRVRIPPPPLQAPKLALQRGLRPWCGGSMPAVRIRSRPPETAAREGASFPAVFPQRPVALRFSCRRSRTTPSPISGAGGGCQGPQARTPSAASGLTAGAGRSYAAELAPLGCVRDGRPPGPAHGFVGGREAATRSRRRGGRRPPP